MALTMFCCNPERLELCCRLLLDNEDLFQGLMCNLMAGGPSKGKRNSLICVLGRQKEQVLIK